ncbi:regulator of microtubule dynamics protein 1-like [Babylonia areolata]|uniref:regulator of microtubule dynamics protein 1-like n=1 Tax=Babylonia areolata TaxID=304850 RepID=UPI003FD4756D
MGSVLCMGERGDVMSADVLSMIHFPEKCLQSGGRGQDLVSISTWVGLLWMALPVNLAMKDHQQQHTRSDLPDDWCSSVDPPSSSATKNSKKEKSDVNSNKKDVDIQALIVEADKLQSEHRYEELCKFLMPYKHIENDELLWRLARTCCVCAKIQGEKGDDHKKKVLMEEGFSFAQRGLKLNDQNPNCHSWYATMMHYSSEIHGIKTQYMNAFIIRDHYEKAVSLNPKDAISLHSLGYWCFEFAHLPWYQKKLLAVLFHSPPHTTFEQALDYFNKAEEASPGFFSMNLVMAGRAHYHLHQYDKARNLFNRALLTTPQSPDDRQAHAKAIEMIKKMDHHHH